MKVLWNVILPVCYCQKDGRACSVVVLFPLLWEVLEVVPSPWHEVNQSADLGCD